MNEAIVVTLSPQMSWSYFLALPPLENDTARLFYAQLAADRLLGVSERHRLLADRTYERTAIANL